MVLVTCQRHDIVSESRCLPSSPTRPVYGCVPRVGGWCRCHSSVLCPHPSLCCCVLCYYQYSSSTSPLGRSGVVPRAAFYNTRAGEAVIAQARADLSARAKPVDHNTHRNTVQDNRQRVYHAECVLPANLANQTPSVAPAFTEYPLQEYNRFNVESRSWSGPSTHPRLKSVPYSKPGSMMDVPRRHDLVKNLKKNQSISNYDHNLPFLAKHTNNLVSC